MPPSTPPKKRASCFRTPNLTSRSVRLRNSAEAGELSPAAATKIKASANPVLRRTPAFGWAILHPPVNARQTTGLRRSTKARRCGGRRERRRLWQKSNNRASRTLRADEQQWPLSNTERNRQIPDQLAVGLYRNRPVGGDERV